MKSEMKKDISDINEEMKNNISEVKEEMKNDISEVKAEVKNDISDLRADMNASGEATNKKIDEMMLFLQKIANQLPKS
jgi:archaellum component FlaC